MPKTKPQPSYAEVLRSVASGLRNAATRPNIYGYKPHEKQIQFHSSPARGRLLLGGNRSGKTVGGAVELCWYATGKHPYKKTPELPVRLRAISVDFLNGVEKIVRPEVARWLPTSELKGGSWGNAYNKELRTLTLENDSFIEFMSYDQDLEKFAGTSRHAIWFDEEPPHDVFIENQMRLIDVAGDWWMTMTPVEGMTWVYDDLYIPAKQDPNILVIEVDMTQNPHLNPGEIEFFMSTLSDDEKKARIHGRFVQVGGLVYKQFSDAHIIDPFRPSKEWMQVAALDHGFNNATAWLWATIDPDGRVYIFDEHYESGKIVRYHADRVHEINRVHGRQPDYYVGDPSIRNTDPITGTSVQLEYIEHGIAIMLGNNDVRAGINRVARYLEGVNGRPMLYITSNCVNLINEMRRYRWSQWASKQMQYDKNKKEEPHKKNDHAVDSLRYLISSRPQVEDGHSVPQNVLAGAGIPEAISVYSGRTDEGASIAQRRYEVDYNMGEEW